MKTIRLIDAELRGMDSGVIVEAENGQQICHLLESMDDAETRMREEYPEAQIVREEITIVCPGCQRDVKELVTQSGRKMCVRCAETLREILAVPAPEQWQLDAITGADEM